MGSQVHKYSYSKYPKVFCGKDLFAGQPVGQSLPSAWHWKKVTCKKCLKFRPKKRMEKIFYISEVK